MTPKEIKELLARYGLRPTRDRGQNFLLDDQVVRKMVVAADIRSDDRVLEIGPGLGMLTETLLEQGARVLAVEIDHGLAHILRERLPQKNLEVLEADFLNCSNQLLAGQLTVGERGYKVVANLPYSITSAALAKLLAEQPRPISLTLMVQYEVALRVTAQPPKTSLLSIVASTYGQPSIVLRVPAGSFWPAPKVDSAVLQILLYSNEEIISRLNGLDPGKFLSVVALAFSEKRKQLKNTLSRSYDLETILHALQQIGVSSQERPERLTFEQWVSLARHLTP
ncbi:ribosomal RNA small subunit methyltransferase A [Patescibacteria group bacterium]|nr:ribosomal RNA small subunit methyltransferase A [Patescibacteria group bacterium]MBU1029334.1 ribosomal RNA small subunit methyltransferase A [Patescibacteria group bacterium]MBU1915603.1 ribosomal RNA small subunit methyltransferase A [Patescibacteria group bacterium]